MLKLSIPKYKFRKQKKVGIIGDLDLFDQWGISVLKAIDPPTGDYKAF